MLKILAFKVHAGDPMSKGIEDVTRAAYTHTALLKDEATNTISEAFFPHVRQRVLDNSELHGIDVFDISQTFPVFTPLMDEQVKGILAYCAEAEHQHEVYSIKGLLDFLPGVQELIGKVRDDGVTCPVFCSQYAFDAIDRGGGLKILNAVSNDLAPGYLPWSVLLRPAAPLKMLTNGPSVTVAASGALDVVKAAADVASALASLPANKTT